MSVTNVEFKELVSNVTKLVEVTGKVIDRVCALEATVSLLTNTVDKLRRSSLQSKGEDQ